MKKVIELSLKQDFEVGVYVRLTTGELSVFIENEFTDEVVEFSIFEILGEEINAALQDRENYAGRDEYDGTACSQYRILAKKLTELVDFIEGVS